MRIYEGSPRQDFEEVLRSIGAILDQRGLREVSLTEIPDGFIVQGLAVEQAGSTWSESYGQQHKETLTFVDDDIARFMEEGIARREQPTPVASFGNAGGYEAALRVIGHYIDGQRPRDVFFFEQEGAYVLRLLTATQAGAKHVLVEFTRDEIVQLAAQAPAGRASNAAPGAAG
ncbi:MAG: hypothetical protein ACLQHS_06530 [Candidatus Limnocylindrales bacterium]|jgi:hypothetical protein